MIIELRAGWLSHDATMNPTSGAIIFRTVKTVWRITRDNFWDRTLDWQADTFDVLEVHR